MLLHELHFGSMGGDGKPMVPAMALALESSFGSVARWRDEFVAMGKALGGGSGWVLLSFLPRDGRLVNQRASDHSQCLAAGVPILALDMYEHAYRVDFGAAAGAYVDAFMDNIAWASVYARYQAAVLGVGESWVPPRRARERASARRAPFRRLRAGRRGAAGLALGRPGRRGPLGRRTARGPGCRRVLRLWPRGRALDGAAAAPLGVKARFLIGGIDGWTTAGPALEAKGGGS